MTPSVLIGVALANFLATLAVGGAVAWCAARPLDKAIRRGASFASHRRLALLLVGGVAAALAAGVSLARPPLPRGCDEFSYLLAADTFAHGRLTNPPHPMWRHLETFHVIQQPTYASKYPPAQGMILALGRILAGTPDLGLWISVGLAAAATCWMLQSWMPPRWALLGGLLVALHPKIQLAWSQTYWGGNVAFLGATLVLGAYPRVVHQCRWQHAVVMALGLAILANSRPYEGLMVSLPVAIAMLFWLLMPATRQSSPHAPREDGSSSALVMRACGKSPHADPPVRRPFTLGRRLVRVLLPATAVLLLTAVWMAYYNQQVTGDPWKLPYAVHESTYGCTPPFLWQTAGPIPAYRHDVIRRLHVEILRGPYEIQQTWPGLLRIKGTELLIIWQFFLGFGLSIPLFALPGLMRRRHFWVVLGMVLAGAAAVAMTTWANPHYFAPAAPALLLLVVQGLRHLRIRSRRMGRRRAAFVRALVLAQAVLLVGLLGLHLGSARHPFVAARAGLQSQLESEPGQHLVLVQYSPDHNLHEEWVYNEADIDAAKVVWARAMNPTADRQLLEYFHDRHVWLLRADENPPRLTPYGSSRKPGR